VNHPGRIAAMGLLALELVALILLFAADDAVNHRGPVATWNTSFQVITAAAIAVFLATALQAVSRGGSF
jgi:hypothetical protein